MLGWMRRLGLKAESDELMALDFLRIVASIGVVVYHYRHYVSLPADSPFNATAKKITKGKASGILSFGIKGGAEAGGKFIDGLQMILRLVNIGDAKSLATHPASTTHRQLGPEELKRAGVREDMVRISVGIEHIDDIIADVEQALAKA